MSKLLYSVTASADGFIAGPGGDMSWLTDHLGGEPDPMVDELVARVGALLVGRRTFFGDDPNAGTEEEGAFEGRWEGPQFVLSRDRGLVVPDGVELVHDVTRAATRARAAAGDGYVNVVGADAARSCLSAGELDEVLVLTAPVLLGDGTRLFDHPGGTDVRLERLQASTPARSVNAWYRVVG